jgi:hypothetical protein
VLTEELVAAHLGGETIPALLSDPISTDIAGLNEQPVESSPPSRWWAAVRIVTC